VNKKLQLVIGIIISVLGLAYAFHNLNFHELGENFSRIHPGLVVLASSLLIFGAWVRGVRWGQLLTDIEKPGLHHLFASVMIGYFGNSVLPFRLGEVLRAYDITTKEKVTFSKSVGALILERLLDLVGLVLVMALFMSVYPLAMNMNEWALVLVVIVLVVFIIIAWFPQVLQKVRSFLEKRNSNTSITGKLDHFFLGIVDGIDSLRGNRHKGGLTFHTIFLWVIYYASLYVVALGVGIHLTWIQIGILLISTTLSIMIPAAPGYVGTYHAVAVLVMHNMFGISLSEAQAVAIILHGIGTLPYIVIGATYFMFSAARIKDINGGMNSQ